MLKTFAFLFLLAFLIGCKKDAVNIPHGTSTHYSQNASVSSTNGPFSFTDIQIDPNPVKKGTVAKVIAIATGKNLTYKWATPHGDIFGTGYSVYYSDSCLGTYQITCTVSDGTNSLTITVPITVTD